MFSVITNIYNKKTQGPTLLELFTATGKQKKFFRQLQMFNVCTTGDTAHIDTILNFLPHTCEHGRIDILHSLHPTIAKWPRWPRIIAAMKNIDEPMLTRVWQELEYRIDLWRVTRGAHIEHL
jgi:hypothetical protein